MNEKLKRDIQQINSRSAGLRKRQNSAAEAEKRRNKPEPPPPEPVSDLTEAEYIAELKKNGIDLEAIAREAALKRENSDD
jgi:hypothetical protein